MAARSLLTDLMVAREKLRRRDEELLEILIEQAEARGDLTAGTKAARNALKTQARRRTAVPRRP